MTFGLPKEIVLNILLLLLMGGAGGVNKILFVNNFKKQQGELSK